MNAPRNVASGLMLAGTLGGIVLCGTIAGCGGSAPVADSQTTTPSGNSSAAAKPAAEQTPESVVSEFLDGVRRGGDPENVARLMTTKSRQEYAAAGLVMEPIGAPDATFEVTRSIPYGDDGVLVNSRWTEKDEAGEPVTYQVGWALRRESEGWRVSGLILEADPEPVVYNFESREDVMALKQGQEGDIEEPADPANNSQTAGNSNFQMPDMR
jgi:hypothetical protein